MNEILIMGNMSDDSKETLRKEFIIHEANKIPDLSAFLRNTGDAITAIATTGFVGVSNDLISLMKNVKIISSNGVGYDSIDANFCANRNIIVTHTPNVLNAEVANTTLMMFLASFRQFRFNEEYLRNGQWEEKGMAPYSHSPDNRTVGILGMGRIGQEIASRLSVFKPKILYHSRSPKNVPYIYYKDLKKMALEVDVLICITPGGPETEKIVNEEILTALGPTGILINVARGSVVDETALVEALENGRLGYAALDVFENEPEVPEKLIKMENVTLLPHVGSATFETRAAMSKLTLDNLLTYKRKGQVLTPVPECLQISGL